MEFVTICTLLLINIGLALSHVANCVVKDLQVVKNFKVNKFEGLWYAYSGLLNTTLEDITRTYLPAGPNTMDVYLRERIPERECSYDKLQLDIRPPGYGEAAKMSQHTGQDGRKPLWVMSTDYTSYAVIYGCDSVVKQTGACDTGSVSSSVWVRDIRKPLSRDTWSTINKSLRSVCTHPELYHRVVHHQHGCKQCDPQQWTVQGDFNISRYMGVWYRVMAIPSSDHPSDTNLQDYYHHYTREATGVRVKVGGRSPTKSGKLEMCSKLPDESLNFTRLPGKMVLRSSKDSNTYYNVIDVHYDEYAFVLGCLNLSCVNYVAWVWSRTPTISGRMSLHITRLMDQYCIDYTLMKPTDHGQDCAIPNRSTLLTTGCIWMMFFLTVIISPVDITVIT